MATVLNLFLHYGHSTEPSSTILFLHYRHSTESGSAIWPIAENYLRDNPKNSRLLWARIWCCALRDSSVRFLYSGFIQQSTPLGHLFTLLNFFRILFRICRVIRIRDSYCAMGHCGEPNFFGIY